VNQQAGTKIDYYIDRHVSYHVTLGPDGTSTGQAKVAFRNDAPTDAPPSYVFGPYEGKTWPLSTCSPARTTPAPSSSAARDATSPAAG